VEAPVKKFAIFLLSFPLVWACQVSSTIDVGMVVSSTGQYSPLLITARNGVILAAEELNAQGGLQFNLHIMDDESSKEVGKSRLQEMIQEGIDLFILSVTSGSYAEMEALINANDLLAISPTVSSDVFKGKDDNFIRMTTDVSGYALILARYAEEAGSEHTLIVYDSNNLQYAQQMIKNFQVTHTVETGSDMTLSVLAFDSTQEVDYSQVGSPLP
jgi:branched-chain amino acid transport system substrate-binding protein